MKTTSSTSGDRGPYVGFSEGSFSLTTPTPHPLTLVLSQDAGKCPPGTLRAAYLEGFCLRAQPLGTQFHHWVGAKCIPDFVLTHGKQPQGRVGLQLCRWDEDGLVPGIHAAQRDGRAQWGWRMGDQPASEKHLLSICKRGQSHQLYSPVFVNIKQKRIYKNILKNTKELWDYNPQLPPFWALIERSQSSDAVRFLSKLLYSQNGLSQWETQDWILVKGLEVQNRS